MSGRKLIGLYLFPLILTSPLSMHIGGAPVFMMQTIAALAVIMAFLFFLVVTRKVKSGKREVMALLLKIYLLVTAVSFFVNSVVDLAQGNAVEIVNRIVSIGFLLLLMSLYLAPRLIIKDFPDIGKIASSLTVGLALISFYFLIKYLGATDLYQTRQEINQRIPQVITYLCWALAATFLMKGKLLSPIKLGVFIAGSIVVFLSLTRASYIQWIISLISFLFIFRKEVSKPVIFCSAAIVAVAAVTVMPLTEFGDMLIERFSMLINAKETAATEHSANLRISIWMAILEKISASPLYLLLGTGQLGPSYLNFSVYSVGGDLFGSTSAHSQYLDTYVRSGLLGLVLEVILILVVIRRSVYLKKSGIYPVFFGGSAAALVGILFYGVFHETLRWQMFGALFWFYAGMVSHVYTMSVGQKNR